MTPPGTSGRDDAYRALRTAAAARVLDREVFSVVGPDARTYLQGQCSQDLDVLEVGGSTEALLLSPQGKIDAYLRVTRTGEEAFVLDTDPGCGEPAVSRLERFRLRVRVEIARLPWVCVAVRGPTATDAVRTGDGTDGAALNLEVEWPGFTGFDLLGSSPPDGPLAWIDDAVPRCDEASWEAARIEAGIPVGGREIVAGTIAAEVGLVERTVSFTKGCFTGQELVARLDARGSKVARRLCGVVVAVPDGGGGPPVGAVLLTGDLSHEVGHLSSVAWSPGRGQVVALATVHRRVTPPEPVVVRWEDGTGEIHEVPAGSLPLPLTD